MGTYAPLTVVHMLSSSCNRHTAKSAGLLPCNHAFPQSHRGSTCTPGGSGVELVCPESAAIGSALAAGAAATTGLGELRGPCALAPEFLRVVISCLFQPCQQVMVRGSRTSGQSNA
jgi:hypothetical protein